MGCEIHYQVVGRSLMTLYNFAGTYVSDLKRAIKQEEELPGAASLLKLFVTKPGGVKRDLDDLETEDVFSFTKLFSEITRANPIAVELPASPAALIASRPRSFSAANGAYPEFNFYINPVVEVDKLGNALLDRKFCLICGHRQSGKSTIAWALLRWLRIQPAMEGVELIYVTFSNIEQNQGPGKFWWSVMMEFYSRNSDRFPLRSHGEMTASAADFKRFFSKSFTTKFGSRPAILIIDEASNLFYNAQISSDVSTHFISAIRDLKVDRENYCLRGLVLVGTEAIKEALAICRSPLSTHNISPFSVESSVPISRFTLSQVISLLDQYANERNVSLDTNDIARDIFELTAGHKGLVGVCGYYLEAAVALSTHSVTMDQWLRQTIFRLPIHVSQQATYLSLIRSLEHLSQGQRNILANVLRKGTHIACLDSETKFLVNEGVLVIKTAIDTKSVELESAAPILRSILLSRIWMPNLEITEPPLDRKVLDVHWLLEHTIEHLHIQHIFSPETSNANQQPSEYAFQAEFTAIFKQLLSQAYPHLGYRVLPEAKEVTNRNGRHRQRLDILLRDGQQPAYGFKLLVAASVRDFDNHLSRSQMYSVLHNCTICFVVNLCADNKLVEYFGESIPGVIPVHVVYDIEKGSANICFRYIKKVVSIKGCEWQMGFTEE